MQTSNNTSEQKIKVSVFMITYNHEKYIAQAVESVLMQKTEFYFELVIGEDCSTDGTRAIVEDYEVRYAGRIRALYSDQNLGVIENAARTLAACRGQYVAMLEGDDYWTDPCKLQKQVDFLEKHPVYALCAHRWQVLAGGNKLQEDGLREHFVGKQVTDVTIDTFLSPYMLRVLAVVCRRKHLSDCLANGRKGVDIVLWAHLLRYGPAAVLNDVMGVYRIHDSGVWSGANLSEKLKQNWNSALALLKDFHDRKNIVNYAQAIGQQRILSSLKQVRGILEESGNTLAGREFGEEVRRGVLESTVDLLSDCFFSTSGPRLRLRKLLYGQRLGLRIKIIILWCALVPQYGLRRFKQLCENSRS